MVHVGDVDAVFERAKARGARVAHAPAAPTSRSASANARSKIGGHRWTFSQTIADVDPVEWGGELVSRS